MLVDFIKHYNMVFHDTILLNIYLYSIVSWCWNCFRYSLHNFRLLFQLRLSMKRTCMSTNISHLQAMHYLVTRKPSRWINSADQWLLRSIQHINVQKDLHSQIKPLGHFSHVNNATHAVSIMCLCYTEVMCCTSVTSKWHPNCLRKHGLVIYSI